MRGDKGDTFVHLLSPDYCVMFDLRRVEISGTGFCLNLKSDVRPWNCILNNLKFNSSFLIKSMKEMRCTGMPRDKAKKKVITLKKRSC